MDDQRVALRVPRYSYADTDRIVGLTHGTAHRWLKGYQYLTGDGQIIRQHAVSGAQAADPGVSFLDLIEVAGIARLRELRISLTTTRRLVARAQALFHTEYPLATLRFRTDGLQVFVEDDSSLVEISGRMRRRAWVEVLTPFLETLEYGADGIATRWWPDGREKQVVIDPSFGFGQPVVAGSGVRTEIVWEQFRAGARLSDIAEDFGVTPELVEHAVQFEARRAEALATAS